MIRKIARSILITSMIGTFGITAFNFHALWRNPTATLLVERATEDVAARIEKQLSTHVTQESIETRIAELLDEQPRNWLVIKAVEEVAADQDIFIGTELQTKRDIADNDDNGVLAFTGKCAACAWNPARCDLSAVVICRVPVDLTPIGDVVGVVRESKHYVFGEEVDMFELGLSAVGLGAVVLVPLTGGTSATVKIGASMAKTAKRMGRISDPLLRLLRRTFTGAIDRDIIAKSSFGSYFADVRRAINPDAIKPALMVVDDLGSIRTSVGIPHTLHLMKNIDTPSDARAIARVADVTGDRTVGVFEVLGKSRVFRSTMRYSDEIIAGIVGVFGFFATLLGLFGSLLGSLSIRILRFFAKL
ncbi:MAG: hypothetical protein JKY41_10010 [Rhodobacteraceae bacterium]|nr:hypothetical protein [Paracoccaceae bacterium]